MEGSHCSAQAEPSSLRCEGPLKDLRGAILDGVDLAGVDLGGKDLSGASLKNVETFDCEFIP